jgi:hypothetical protein
LARGVSRSYHSPSMPSRPVTTDQPDSSPRFRLAWAHGVCALGACPTLTFLLRRTICSHLRRSRPEKILNVFQRIHLRFFRACGLASCRTSFVSSRTAMSDRLLVYCPIISLVVSLSNHERNSLKVRALQRAQGERVMKERGRNKAGGLFQHPRGPHCS